MQKITCLIDRVLSGAGMKSHTSMLGTFLVYVYLGPVSDFQEKSSRSFLGESSKLFIVVTLLHENVWNFLPEIYVKIFS